MISLLTTAALAFGPPTTVPVPGGTAFGAHNIVSGDFDSDGLVDLAVADRLAGTGGAVTVWMNDGSGFGPTPTQTFSGATGTEFGHAMATGDLNGDGYTDLVVSAPAAPTAALARGRVSVYAGGPLGLDASPLVTVAGAVDGYRLGDAVAVGDTDGDGVDDLVVGSPVWGTVHVHLGTANGPDAVGLPQAVGNGFGGSFALLDLDLDGLTDICSEYSTNNVICYASGAAGPTNVQLFNNASVSGARMSGRGDFDDDGYDDLVVRGLATDTVRVFAGSAAGLPAVATAILYNPSDPDCAFGHGSATGDVDGDGYDDLIVGVSCTNGATASPLVFPGGANGLTDGRWEALSGLTPGDSIATAATPGDLDGDGLEDILIAEGTTGKNALHVYTGTDDADGDGFTLVNGDCNDANLGVHPGAAERCNSIDDDCDGLIDEVIVAYVDFDKDGYGDGNTLATCATPGAVAKAGDCDDKAALVHPGALERCDGVDQDCDKFVDDFPVDAPTWYGDADEDGFGGDIVTVACALPVGFIALGGDCDDLDPLAFPGGAEVVGDSVDGDCDGTEMCYRDADSDGFRTTNLFGSADTSCEGPGEGKATDALDCNDLAPTTFPGAPEVCNGRDDDCDTTVDEDNPPAYRDADSDGLGDASDTVTVCPRPAGYVGVAGDCDDADATVGAPEVMVWLDLDGDGVGRDGVPSIACSAGPGQSTTDGDCDDADPDVFPDATETPADGVDADCDALEECYLDVDLDGWRGEDTLAVDAALECIGSGLAREDDPSGDCDDRDPAVHPEAVERANLLDDDCNGLVDETTTEVDDDGDGYCEAPACADGALPGDCDDGDPAVSPRSCEVPGDGIDNDCSGAPDDPGASASCKDLDGDGVLAADGDCNDRDPDVYLGAPESCDGFDQDCDGLVPVAEWDLDRDGWLACDGDCDDRDPRARPYAAEQCGNGIDDDCDGTVDKDADGDGDGFTTCSGDCRDDDDEVRPGRAELQNGIDDDCDGRVDEGYDADGDGFQICGGPIPAGECDCDDTDPLVRPFRAEACGNGVDDNCDGRTDDDRADHDGDGVGACDGDCDDDDPLVSPWQSEVCNNADDDCDGVIDDGFDRDDDTDRSCTGDCDDREADVFRSAPEECDTLDNDCNAVVDDEWLDVDGDGLTVCAGDCADDDPTISPDVDETEALCGNGVDDDCDETLDWEDDGCDPEALPAFWYACDTGRGGVGALAFALLLATRRRR